MSDEIGVEVPKEDDERRRQRNLEEALVKSLRRIISAYLNYPEAAEEDVKRYERLFRMLPPSHKALLSYYPLKFKKLRRCISMNSYIMFAMLQAFDPPLDMSQDMDICQDPYISHTHCDSRLIDGRNVCSGQSTSSSGRMCCSKVDQICCKEQSDIVETAKEMSTNEEVETEGPVESKAASYPADLENCCNDVAYSNGNVSSSPCNWLDPSVQLNVPLVDVDKLIKSKRHKAPNGK